MSVNPTKLLTTQLPIVDQDPPRPTQGCTYDSQARPGLATIEPIDKPETH
jgi:hypothetical protein